jgi:hypothetical protein
LPATSLAPVVITPLYLVPFAKCAVVDAPKGSSVALRPSVLRATLTSVMRVVLPSGLSFKSLKVEVVIERGSIYSEKVGVVVVPHSALRHPLPEQALRASRQVCREE